MSDVTHIIGYHGTCSKHKGSIDSNGFDPTKVQYRDDHWLGQGVYFFQDFSTALWWGNDIARKPWNSGTYPLVYKSIIEVENDRVLDLDERQELDKFYTFVINSLAALENSTQKLRPNFTDVKLRAVFFDLYKKEYDIAVIIYTYTRAPVPYAEFRDSYSRDVISRVSKVIQLGYHEKQICVSDKTCIIESQIVYNGYDEVI